MTFKLTRKADYFGGTVLLYSSRRDRSANPAAVRPKSATIPKTRHCMLVSRSIRGSGKAFTKIHPSNLESNGSLQPSRAGNLRSLHLQVQGSRKFDCQQKHIFQALLLKRPSSASQRLGFSKSSFPATTLQRRSIITMATADRSILPDTYVLSSIARDFRLTELA